ncbi:hypothetical protein B0G84_6221 [Paraburkholderia sp. BL8N3]|nr:hypothetical protein [Paraburkholderia sp. BL8N3]TCK37166.1 hypothetical protein B0G84_6221 [Paraburkholderia sp. BL8N3]
MASEKIRVLKIDNEKITSKKTGQIREMRVLHCFIESSYEDPESGELIDGSFVAKTSLFDEKVQVAAGEEYLVTYRLGEGYGQDAGRMVPRIVSWTPAKQPKPVGKPSAGVGAV